MTPLTNGRYRTAAGSAVTVSGAHAGIYDIAFDWLEEGACIEAAPVVDACDGRLRWQCECHGDFDAALRSAAE